MLNDLVSSLDLAGFPGVPFDETLIDNAVAQVRARAGWHIAPVRTETVTVQAYGGSPWLVLPTRRPLAVSAVRRNGAVVLGYSASSSGMLFRELRGGWEYGTYEVDLTHGYEECPPELLALVASLSRADAWSRDPSIASVSRGPFSESYRADASGILDGPLLQRYALPAAVA